MPQMTIGGLARAADVSVETVRFYERKGLIEQPIRPRDGGYRQYTQEAVERIRFIREAQGLGFSLNEAAELLSLRTHPHSDCASVRSIAQEKRSAVVAKIEMLCQIRAALDQLIAACPGRGPTTNCSILEALSDQKLAQLDRTGADTNG